MDGKNEKPGMDYCFGGVSNGATFNWTHNKNTVLLELDIPDQFVLLSDANAWYCVMQGLPCYEYESEEDEKRVLNRFHENAEKISALKTEKDMASAVYILYREAENT